jgi:AraC-like DNA-binding protein
VEPHRTAVERVITAMRQRLDQELSLEEMGEIAYLSPFHFARIFRELTGIPPGQFLGALRLDKARELLLTTEAPVTDICFEAGYNSLGSFTSRFTQLVGISPGKLRGLKQRPRALSLRDLQEGLRRRLASGRAAEGWLEARLETPTAQPSWTFVGLFPRAIPQARPWTCALLDGEGSFRIAIPREGSFHLFAVGFGAGGGDLESLWSLDSVVAVGTMGPVSHGDPGSHGDEGLRLVLRAPDPLDPPLLATLPLLIQERLAVGRSGG